MLGTVSQNIGRCLGRVPIWRQAGGRGSGLHSPEPTPGSGYESLLLVTFVMISLSYVPMNGVLRVKGDSSRLASCFCLSMFGSLSGLRASVWVWPGIESNRFRTYKSAFPPCKDK